MSNIVVVGGTKGIGEQIVKQLADENVYVVARAKGELAETETIHFISADVTSNLPALDNFPEVVDGFVYCPGSINLKPFHRLAEEDFLMDWHINFFGAVKMLQLLLPNLKKSTQPSVVLFSTVAASTGMPFHASIAAAKGAVEALTKSLAAEWAPKITVNCIAPSLTQTPLAEKLLNTPDKMEGGGKRHPLQRIGQPDEIAALACFLLSNKAGWVTGQVMHADGGMSTLKT